MGGHRLLAGRHGSERSASSLSRRRPTTKTLDGAQGRNPRSRGSIVFYLYIEQHYCEHSWWASLTPARKAHKSPSEPILAHLLNKILG